MMLKKDVVIAVLATFCLTATLFIIIPIRSQTEPEYDPWIDTNDDGAINYLDGIKLGAIFGATGTPINKTALLLELQSRIDNLNASLQGLEAYFTTWIATLETSLAEQQSRIFELENELAILNATKLRQPDYDSFREYGGWKYIEPDGYWIFEHRLNTTNVLVYLIFYDNATGNIHQKCYGGEVTAGWWGGAWWSDLTNFTITVHRYIQDTEWNYVRIMIWKIPES